MSCATFVGKAFALRTAVHVAHLLTRSYAQHVALGDFYDGLLDLTDEYAELAQGLEGAFKSIPHVPPPKGTPVELLKDFLELLKDEFDEDRGSQALTNTLAEMESLTLRTIYKLENLK